MNKKQKLNQQVDKLTTLLEKFGNYLAVFEQMPPKGEMAKISAIQEFNDVVSQTIQTIKIVKNKQIEILEANNE